jgi:hypothetical protein
LKGSSAFQYIVKLALGYLDDTGQAAFSELSVEQPASEFRQKANSQTLECEQLRFRY